MMSIFNETIPYKLDIQWVKGDKFTFLSEKIIVWSNKACSEGLNVSVYDGILEVKNSKNEDPLISITTSSGDMIFTDNEISFSKLDLSLKVDDYFYSLKLVDKVDTTIVGTLFEGRFKVIN